MYSIRKKAVLTNAILNEDLAAREGGDGYECVPDPWHVMNVPVQSRKAVEQNSRRGEVSAVRSPLDQRGEKECSVRIRLRCVHNTVMRPTRIRTHRKRPRGILVYVLRLWPHSIAHTRFGGEEL